MPTSDAEHWERAYTSTTAEEVSWYQPAPKRSLAMIERAGIGPEGAILDVGGGASRLAGHLLRAGYRDITVADVSAAAIGLARSELGTDAERVSWLQIDIRTDRLERRYDLWHDRAVFHFMVDAADRDGYRRNLRSGLRPGGHLVIAAFGPEGPTICSGLPVHRYAVEELQMALGSGFELLSSELEAHRTPAGSEQQFLYAHLRRTA